MLAYNEFDKQSHKLHELCVCIFAVGGEITCSQTREATCVWFDCQIQGHKDLMLQEMFAYDECVVA